MKYSIALRNTKTNGLELTDITFSRKKDALDWKKKHDELCPNMECRVYQRISDGCIGKVVS